MTQANDSVAVTPGTGATVATHLVNSKEYQVVVLAGDDGHIKGSKDAYVATYKLATDAAASALSKAHTANSEFQYATIHHLATAVKTVKVRRIELYIAATAASVVEVVLRRLTATTAPATGNPAITPLATNTATAAAEATCLALPTTAGSFTAGAALFSQEINLGANTANTTTWPPDPVVLWPAEGDGVDDVSDLVIRAGVQEGYAVAMRTVAAVTMKATARIIFTEH